MPGSSLPFGFSQWEWGQKEGHLPQLPRKGSGCALVQASIRVVATLQVLAQRAEPVTLCRLCA